MIKNHQLLLEILLLFLVGKGICWAHDEGCPHRGKLQKKDIQYESLVGEWVLLGSSPQVNEYCKNTTVIIFSGISLTLHQEYLMKLFGTWMRRTQTYHVERQTKPSPLLELNNRAWYSLETLNYNLIATDYSTYMVFYLCNYGFFSNSERLEVWKKKGIKFKKEILTNELTDVLDKFNTTSEQLSYRNRDQCFY